MGTPAHKTPGRGPRAVSGVLSVCADDNKGDIKTCLYLWVGKWVLRAGSAKNRCFNQSHPNNSRSNLS
ncbi:hypothetical protein BN1012_Phect1856 [Candidatus Phaeomarinobacter ectocarpi]|uniref:Uncharacterized protein n=1 Tax=Candidatus Phaeomarinibacter ectocarpi TaxID=1458461 RepID=X5MFQ8_9HYPH|nr:hypothetical protein BN1012_Phect1856 [Candidatus Phaeomarinobacter ectocarpi]